MCVCRELGVTGDSVVLSCLELTLGHIALKMGHEPKPQGILNVHSFYGDEVPCYFRGTFSESQHTVVHGVRMGLTIRMKRSINPCVQENETMLMDAFLYPYICVRYYAFRH